MINPFNFLIDANRWRRLSAAVALVLLSGCAGHPVQKTPHSAKTATPAAATASHPRAARGRLDNTAAPPSTPPRAAVLLPGSGQFFTTPAAPASVAAGTGPGIQLGFVDTDIRTVVSNLLGDALGLRYVIDPAIKGTITLQSARPVQKEQLLRALEAALSLQNIALVDHDGTYEVVPMAEARGQVTRLRLPDSAGAPGFGIQVVPLRYTSAQAMDKLLQPFAPPNAIVRVDSARNLLVLAGTSPQLASMMDVVRTFDVDWLAGMSYAFFPVEYVDAGTIVDELKPVFEQQNSPLAGIVRLVPLSRLNTILVASPQPEYLQRVGEWIKRLDLGDSTPGRHIYVYDVQNGRAADLARTLNRIFGTGSSGAAPSSPSLSSSAGYRSRGGTAGMGYGPRLALTPSLGSAGPPGGLQPPQSPVLGSGPPVFNQGPATTTATGLRIVPDESTNTLLVLATPDEFSLVNAAIKRLDVTPRQVLIEASLAEVTLTDDLKFGVEWALKSSAHSVTFSPNSGGTLSSQFPGFSYVFSGASSIRAVLNALESITRVKVLSAPKLLVLNNHPAEIDVGDQVPILTQQAVSVSQTNAPIVNSVEQRNTGVILHVTPRVNQSGMVILDIAQEVSSVVPTTTSNIDSPTIQERMIRTSVAVRNGDTIALGGLISDSRSRGNSGLPWLQRLPLLGALFGTTSRSNTRTELIIFITPRVMRDPAEMHQVMDRLHAEFDSVEKQTRQPPDDRANTRPR